MLMVFVMIPFLWIRRKSMKSKEILRNSATITLAMFFAYVIAGSIGFQRVAAFVTGLVRKGAF